MCFIHAKHLLFGAWKFCWILVLQSGRLMRMNNPPLGKCERVNVTPVAPAPSGGLPGQTHFENQNKCCATLRPNAYFFCDVRPRPPAGDYKCGDKSNLFGQVRSRVTKRSLSRPCKTECAKIVVWPETNTNFEHPRTPNFNPSSRNLSE